MDDRLSPCPVPATIDIPGEDGKPRNVGRKRSAGMIDAG
jgi:hypothetical protein